MPIELARPEGGFEPAGLALFASGAAGGAEAKAPELGGDGELTMLVRGATACMPGTLWRDSTPDIEIRGSPVMLDRGAPSATGSASLSSSAA
jgi:hypothetical protein